MRMALRKPGAVVLCWLSLCLSSFAHLDDGSLQTDFRCEGREVGGYYADTRTDCRMFHICAKGTKGEVLDMRFLCLKGSAFNPRTRSCGARDTVNCTEEVHDSRMFNRVKGYKDIDMARRPSRQVPFFTMDDLPQTEFSCKGRKFGRYYADAEANCQMFHICAQGSSDEILDFQFLCLNGTVFDEKEQQCRDYRMVKCGKASTTTTASTNVTSDANSTAATEDATEEVTNATETHHRTRREAVTVSGFVVKGIASDQEAESSDRIARAIRHPPQYSMDNMPLTGFTCDDKVTGGYYADPDTDCQLYHVCTPTPTGGVLDYKFLCSNGTIFSQQMRTCLDWRMVDCRQAVSFYKVNDDLPQHLPEEAGLGSESVDDGYYRNKPGRNRKKFRTVQGRGYSEEAYDPSVRYRDGEKTVGYEEDRRTAHVPYRSRDYSLDLTSDTVSSRPHHDMQYEPKEVLDDPYKVLRAQAIRTLTGAGAAYSTIAPITKTFQRSRAAEDDDYRLFDESFYLPSGEILGPTPQSAADSLVPMPPKKKKRPVGIFVPNPKTSELRFNSHLKSLVEAQREQDARLTQMLEYRGHDSSSSPKKKRIKSPYPISAETVEVEEAPLKRRDSGSNSPVYLLDESAPVRGRPQQLVLLVDEPDLTLDPVEAQNVKRKVPTPATPTATATVIPISQTSVQASPVSSDGDEIAALRSVEDGDPSQLELTTAHRRQNQRQRQWLREQRLQQQRMQDAALDAGAAYPASLRPDQEEEETGDLQFPADVPRVGASRVRNRLKTAARKNKNVLSPEQILAAQQTPEQQRRGHRRRRPKTTTTPVSEPEASSSYTGQPEFLTFRPADLNFVTPQSDVFPLYPEVSSAPAPSRKRSRSHRTSSHHTEDSGGNHPNLENFRTFVDMHGLQRLPKKSKILSSQKTSAASSKTSSELPLFDPFAFLGDVPRRDEVSGGGGVSPQLNEDTKTMVHLSSPSWVHVTTPKPVVTVEENSSKDQVRSGPVVHLLEPRDKVQIFHRGQPIAASPEASRHVDVVDSGELSKRWGSADVGIHDPAALTTEPSSKAHKRQTTNNHRRRRRSTNLSSEDLAKRKSLIRQMLSHIVQRDPMFDTEISATPPSYNMASLPATKFSCKGRVLGGYYADPDAGCQLFHICARGRKGLVYDFRFLCANGTVFSQKSRTCDDWKNVDCSEAVSLYPKPELEEREIPVPHAELRRIRITRNAKDDPNEKKTITLFNYHKIIRSNNFKQAAKELATAAKSTTKRVARQVAPGRTARPPAVNDVTPAADQPLTSFSCTGKENGRYYADPETNCNMFHLCSEGKSYRFLCKAGTVFDQRAQACDDQTDHLNCKDDPAHYGIGEYFSRDY